MRHEIRVPQPFGRADSPRQAGVCGSPQTLEHTNTSVRHVKVVGQFSSASVGLVVSGTSAVVHDQKQEYVALSPSARAIRPTAASARWVVGRAKWSTGPHCPLQQACSIRLPSAVATWVVTASAPTAANASLAKHRGQARLLVLYTALRGATHTQEAIG